MNFFKLIDWIFYPVNFSFITIYHIKVYNKKWIKSYSLTEYFIPHIIFITYMSIISYGTDEKKRVFSLLGFWKHAKKKVRKLEIGITYWYIYSNGLTFLLPFCIF